MTKTELEDVFTDPELEITPEYAIENIRVIDNCISLNGFVGLPVNSISVGYQINKDIEIVDEQDELIGILCNVALLKELPRELLTEYKYYAFLIDSCKEDFVSNNVIYNQNYFFVREEEYEDYKTLYMETSALWGKFQHHIQGTTYTLPVKEMVNKITAIKKLTYPTFLHKDISERALLDPYAFERFLKSYHLIELISDYYFVEEIKKLNDDLYGIGDLLSGYDSNDLNKLRIIFHSKIHDISKIVSSMELIKNHQDISRDIFQKYSKKGNPLTDNSDFDKLLSLTDFSETTLKRDLKKIGNKYQENILNLVTYWLYRIRCSIAHSKIGEYIFRTTDENYIIDFAQKLIDSVILELLKDES